MAQPHRVWVYLRRARQQAGWSLPQAADKAAVTQVRLGSWERGDRQATLDAVDRVAAQYGLQIGLVPRGRGRHRALDAFTLEKVMAACREMAGNPETGEQDDMCAL